jgi:hypothetical protein
VRRLRLVGELELETTSAVIALSIDEGALSSDPVIIE